MTSPFQALAADRSFESVLQKDPELNALINPTYNINFAFATEHDDHALIIEVQDGAMRVGGKRLPDFTLRAATDIWARYLHKEQELGSVVEMYGRSSC